MKEEPNKTIAMETTYNSMVIYRSWIETIKKLPIGEIDKYEAIMAILDYGFSCLDSGHWAVDMVREQIDVNNRRRENGRLGGRPKNQTITKPKPNDNQTETKEEPNHNLIENSIIVNDNSIIDNGNSNINLKENNVKEKKFKPPTKEEAAQYIKENNYNIDIEIWYNYYETRGWRLSDGKKMKNWKSSLAYWNSTNNNYNNNKKSKNHGRDKNNNDGFSGTGYTGDTI